MNQWSETTARSVFLIVCGLVALTGLWFDLKPYACPVSAALLVPESNPPPCFEFWLNRYQTLTGVLAAIAAAGLAWAGVQRQIDVAARQTSASMVNVINDRLAASVRLHHAVAVIDAYDVFSFQALQECIDIIEMLEVAAANDDESFEAMVRYDLAPAVEAYADCVQYFRNSARQGIEEIKNAIVVGQARVEAEDYFASAVTMSSFHNVKLRRLRRFCEIDQNKYINREKEVVRFREIISREGDRINFQTLPAFGSTQVLRKRLSMILEATVKKAEEGLL